eukprot:GHRR01018386.1.p1 GENE.GHRR01018386.1~~GHRR01018386.1.p1  ORF type:complete len:141 (-),score=36.47 GHRR01018386.1:178-600(-)
MLAAMTASVPLLQCHIVWHHPAVGMGTPFSLCCHRYVSGRVRKPGEINGKAANLNNCLKNVIYQFAARSASLGDARLSKEATDAADGSIKAGDSSRNWQSIPAQEMVVIFDADMVCNPTFFRYVSHSVARIARTCWARHA